MKKRAKAEKPLMELRLTQHGLYWHSGDGRVIVCNQGLFRHWDFPLTTKSQSVWLQVYRSPSSHRYRITWCKYSDFIYIYGGRWYTESIYVSRALIAELVRVAKGRDSLYIQLQYEENE